MSWLSSVLNKKIPIIGESVGGLLGAATGNPAVMVGTEAARGGNTGQNIVGDAAQGAKNTPLAIAGAHVLGGASNPASGPAGASDGTGGATNAGGSDGSSSAIQGLLDAAKGGAGAVVDFLKNHGSDLLEAAGVADAAYRETEANKYATDALKQAQAGYDAKAPLRALGIAGMGNAGIGNPFATKMVNGAPAAPGAPAALPIAGAAPSNAPPNILDQIGQNQAAYQTPPRTGPAAAPSAPRVNPGPALPMRIAGM